MEARNWNNVECIPLPQKMVGLEVGGKLVPKGANISACSSEEIIQKIGSK